MSDDSSDTKKIDAVSPRCPYFGDCGGCSSQHIPYDVQLAHKKERFAGLLNIDPTLVEVIHDEQYKYRTRMDFIFMKNGLGCRKKGRWDQAVNIDECAIASDAINTVLAEVKEEFKDAWVFYVKKKTGAYRYAVIRSTSDGKTSLSLVLNERSSRLKEEVEKIKAYATKSSADNIVITYMPPQRDEAIGEEYFVVKGDDMLCETLLEHKFYFSVQGFFQNNYDMAEKLHTYVRSYITKYAQNVGTDLLSSNGQLLDLYGGVGTFGINNAAFFKDVVVVEDYAGSIECAKKNADENGVRNVECIVSDAKQLKNIPIDAGRPLFVITDPPRSGMHKKTIARLKELSPDVIMYISCNVNQLAKEISQFDEYELEDVAMFDLFPNTPHIEGLVVLKKSKKLIAK